LAEPASDHAAALKALTSLGWTVREGRSRLPPAIDARYPAIPPAVRAFLEGLAECARADDAVWFLTPGDYAREDDETFDWNAFETMELAEAVDAAERAAVVRFWNAHLPILLSVQGDYAHLSVRVDPNAAGYGEVVRGDAPEFSDVTVVAPSLGDLLARIAAMPERRDEPDLDDLLRDPHDPKQLASPPGGLFSGLVRRLRGLRVFERYRIGVVHEPVFSRPLWAWETWRQVMPPLSSVIAGLPSKAQIRPRQAGDHDNWLRFGALGWSDEANRTWTQKYLADPAFAGKATFFATEIWAPSRPISFEARRGPELFCLVDRNQAGGGQGFVLAIRKDVLPPVSVAADAAVFAVREQLPDSKCEIFERTWGEHGRFGSLVVDNPLDHTSSETVWGWGRAHPKARARSFRWKP
jgi:hypothetical protein